MGELWDNALDVVKHLRKKKGDKGNVCTPYRTSAGLQFFLLYVSERFSSLFIVSLHVVSATIIYHQWCRFHGCTHIFCHGKSTNKGSPDNLTPHAALPMADDYVTLVLSIPNKQANFSGGVGRVR